MTNSLLPMFRKYVFVVLSALLLGVFFFMPGTQLRAQTTTTSITGTTVVSTTTTSAPTTTTLGLPVFRRYFPTLVNSASQTTGLAIVNLLTSPANLTFKAYSNSGNLLASSQRTLMLRNQLAQVIGQTLPSFQDASGWMIMESSVPNVEGFFMLFDWQLTIMDGAAVSGTTLRDFIIPVSDDGEIILANPSNSPAIVNLAYASEAGTAAAPMPTAIPAMGRNTVSLSSLRPGGAKGGYLRGQGDAIVPLAVIGKPGWIAVLAPLDVIGQTTAGSTRFEATRTLYAPQYAIGGGFSTVMDLVNLESAAMSLSLKWFGDNGAQIGTTGSVILAPRGSQRIASPSIFGITAGANVMQGYIQVQSADGNFAGWVRFTDPAEEKFGSALQFVGKGMTTTYFSHVAQNNIYFTGLAALNPNQQTALTNISLFEIDGSLIATGNQQIPPGGRFSKLLPELVGNFPPRTNGYFVLTSNLPVASFALFGTNSGDVLSAIPPQFPSDVPLPPTTTTTTSTTLWDTRTTTTTTTSTSSTRATTTTVTTTTVTTSTVTTSSTTTTIPGTPPFAPDLLLGFSSLKAGTSPDILFNYSQAAGELNVRSIEIQFDAGRLDLAKLNPPGKVLGSATANMAGQPLTVNHVLISNDGTTVVTEFRANVGFVLAVADGEYTNVGADGVRLRISIRNPLPFPDGTTTGDAFSFGLPVGSIFVLPSQVGKTFNATTILTSVLWPGPGGTACSVQRKQSFITTP